MQNFERKFSAQEILILFNHLDKGHKGIIYFHDFNEHFNIKKNEKSQEQNENYKVKSLDEKKNHSQENEWILNHTSKKQPKENKRYSMNTAKPKKFTNFNDKDFFYFKMIIEEGRKIEILKQNEALMPEFNFITAFETLLLNKCFNYLNLEDFQVFLENEINEDLSLFFRKYANSSNKNIIM